jgi:hypothetical protein
MQGEDNEDKRDVEKKRRGCKSNSDRKTGDRGRFDRVGTYEDILISPLRKTAGRYRALPRKP